MSALRHAFPVRIELLAVVDDHAGRFLAAVLEGVQAKRGMGGGILVALDAENAAFLMELVVERRARDH